MTIYFINKNSRLKGPFDITDTHRNKIMCIGDVCIRETSNGLAFLLICNGINTWNSCKCVGTTKGCIGIEGNSLLFYFDGITKRYGRKEELSKLYEFFDKQPIHDFFQNAIDIITYKCDLWDVSLFLRIHQLSKIQNDDYAESPMQDSANHITKFEMYLTDNAVQLFRELFIQGNSLRNIYKTLRKSFPDEFRQSLKNFLRDNPSLTIYDK